jgi:glutamate synthase domain-containing protein 2
MRDRVRIIASGKIFSAFHLLRAVALGADTANSARGMMFSLGCIQSRSCNTDRCPTGIATQNPSRNKALVVEDKGKRVENFHHEMIENLVELLAVCGLDRLEELEPRHINQRVKGTVIKNYAELYPVITSRCLLSDTDVPDNWQKDWTMASADHW